MYELFEHKADMGIRGSGKTPEEAFAEAGKAMFSIMVDLKDVKAEKAVEFKVDADTKEQLFIEWLNELLYLKDVEEMLFSDFKLGEIDKKGDNYFIDGFAMGEAIDKERHTLRTEVKAATYSGLKIYEKKGMFFVECIVDV